MTDVDPGFGWFRDYYRQFTTVEAARAFIQVGTVVALDPPQAKNFLVTALDEDTFAAVTVSGPKETIQPKYSDVVFPGNLIYALEFDKETSEAAIGAVVVRGLHEEIRRREHED